MSVSRDPDTVKQEERLNHESFSDLPHVNRDCNDRNHGNKSGTCESRNQHWLPLHKMPELQLRTRSQDG